MAKDVKLWRCSACGGELGRWMYKCPKTDCGGMGTLEEVTETFQEEARQRAGLKSSGAVAPDRKALTIAELKQKPLVRLPTGLGELDRVLGGGFVPAEVVLFGGRPGAGKSTLALAVANSFAKQGLRVLYSSGEESEQQIGLRAARMEVDDEHIRIVNETNLEIILGHLEEEDPALLILDSLQTVASSEIPGSVGSVTQAKEAAHTLTRLAKQKNIMMLLINQVVKDGEFAGSEGVQHIVDATLMLESDGETPLKFLRANKNRFGDTTEVGVFQHGEKGLEEVTDPSGIFLEKNEEEVSGAACTFMSEGVRQIPVEVHALVTRSTLPQPRKQFNGVHYNRGQIVCAILDKFCNAKLFENDVFVSTVSGVKVQDPQADLAMAAAMISSSKGVPLPQDMAFIGELSLTGHVRGSFMVEAKIREAARLGFTKLVVPSVALKVGGKTSPGVKLIPLKTVKELPRLLAADK